MEPVAVTNSVQQPLRGYVARMRVYCKRMYPLPARLLNAVALYAGLAILVSRINGLPVELVSAWSLLGVIDLFLLALLLRLMDELKDREIDRTLFADRPVPSRMVLESDVRVSIAAVTAAYTTLNLLSLSTLWLAVACLAYTYLMFAYFFMPTLLRRYLLLNLATHNPSVPLMMVLVVAVVAAQHGLSLVALDWFRTSLAVMMFWCLLLGWELARKIRSREEENDYVTYSQIFGRVPATLITWAVQTVPLVIGIVLARTIQVSLIYYLLLVTAYGVVAVGHVRFMLWPSPRTSQLRRPAELYTMLVVVALVGDFLVTDLTGGWR